MEIETGIRTGIIIRIIIRDQAGNRIECPNRRVIHGMTGKEVVISMCRFIMEIEIIEQRSMRVQGVDGIRGIGTIETIGINRVVEGMTIKGLGTRKAGTGVGVEREEAVGILIMACRAREMIRQSMLMNSTSGARKSGEDGGRMRKRRKQRKARESWWKLKIERESNDL